MTMDDKYQHYQGYAELCPSPQPAPPLQDYFLRDHPQRAINGTQECKGAATAAPAPTALEILGKELEQAHQRIAATAAQVESFVARTIGLDSRCNDPQSESLSDKPAAHAPRLADISNEIHKGLTRLGHAVDQLGKLA